MASTEIGINRFVVKQILHTNKHMILGFPIYSLYLFPNKTGHLNFKFRERERERAHTVFITHWTKKIHKTPHTSSYLKGEQRNHNCHPADSHCDVRPPLFSNHIHWTQEQNRPNDVIEHHQAEKGHQDPQRNADNLKEKRSLLLSALPSDAFSLAFIYLHKALTVSYNKDPHIKTKKEE